MFSLFSLAHPVRRALAANTGFQLAGRIAGSVTTFLVTVIIARTLGASGYGDFVKVTTFVSFFYLFADFGLNAFFLQTDNEISPRNGIKQSGYWYTLFGFRLVISIVLAVAAALFSFVLPGTSADGYTQQVKTGIVLFSLSIILQGMITSSNAMFQKYLAYKNAAWSIIVGSIVTLGTLAFSYMTQGSLSLMKILLSLLTGSAASAVLHVWLAMRFEPDRGGLFFFRRWTPLFIRAAPLGLTLVFNVVYFHIDSVILTVSRPTAEVGLYGLAFKVFELLLVFPTFFMNALYPVLLKAASSDERLLQKLFYRAMAYLGVGSCVIALFVWISAPVLGLIRNEFLASIPALKILLLGTPLFFLSSLTMWTLIAQLRQSQLMMIYGVSMIVNIALNILFVPQYGYIAAAWITGACEAVVFIWSYNVVKRNFTISQTGN